MEGDSRLIYSQCQNGQGGDITDDRLPKAEFWWAGGGAEAKGKKSLDSLGYHFRCSFKNCLLLDYSFFFDLFLCLDSFGAGCLIILLDGLQEPELGWRAGGGGTLGRFSNYLDSKSRFFPLNRLWGPPLTI